VCALDRAISKLSFELGIGPISSSVLGFRLQNLKTGEDTVGHGITP